MINKNSSKATLQKHTDRGSVEIDSGELTSYIQSVLNGIQTSQNENFKLKSDVEFELSIIVKKSRTNAILLALANLHAKSEDQKTSKIKFTMGLNGEKRSKSILRNPV